MQCANAKDISTRDSNWDLSGTTVMGVVRGEQPAGNIGSIMLNSIQLPGYCSRLDAFLGCSTRGQGLLHVHCERVVAEGEGIRTGRSLRGKFASANDRGDEPVGPCRPGRSGATGQLHGAD